MKSKIYLIAFFASLVLTGMAQAQPVTVNDADFETPVVVTLPLLGGLQEYDTISQFPTGWTVNSGTVTLVNQGILGALLTPITGDASNQYLVLNGLAVSLPTLTPGALGDIRQGVTTTIGQTYTVSYQAGALNLAALTGTSPFTAGVVGLTPGSGGPTLLTANIGTFQNMSFTFTAVSTTSVLEFGESNALAVNVGGVAIDNVSVTPVPEPRDSLAILLAAGCLILALRRLKVQGLQV